MLWLTNIQTVTNRHKCSAKYKPIPLEIKLLWNENLTFYDPKQNEIVTLWLLQYESAVTHKRVLLKFAIFKNFSKKVIFGFIGHAKFTGHA